MYKVSILNIYAKSFGVLKKQWKTVAFGHDEILTPSVSGKVPFWHLLDNGKVPNPFPEI